MPTKLLVSERDHLSQHLKSGRDGRSWRWRYAPGDPEALAAAVLESLTSRPDPAPLRRRAEMFNVKYATESYLELLDLQAHQHSRS